MRFHGCLLMRDLRCYVFAVDVDKLGWRILRESVTGRGIELMDEYGVVFSDGGGITGSRSGSGTGLREGVRQRNEAHLVLEAMASTTLDLYAEGKERVGVFGHDLGEALGARCLVSGAHLTDNKRT